MLIYSEKAVPATLNVYEANKEGNSICVMWVRCSYSENFKLCTACIFSIKMCHFILIGFKKSLKNLLNKGKKKEKSQFLLPHQQKNSVLVLSVISLSLQWIACNLIQCGSKFSNLLVFSSDTNNIRGLSQ